MSQPAQNPFDILLDQIRAVVREEVKAVIVNGGDTASLLTPEELAGKMNIPVSWVYEQSRQGNIPTHRIGKYIRFDLAEVLRRQKEKSSTP